MIVPASKASPVAGLVSVIASGASTPTVPLSNQLVTLPSTSGAGIISPTPGRALTVASGGQSIISFWIDSGLSRTQSAKGFSLTGRLYHRLPPDPRRHLSRQETRRRLRLV